ncbi:MAG: molybdopterin molybdotransferase MoeA [Rhodocyclaceae bacterium]|jgi:molybdopterin molybdotransferase|nr:molybdopterin molybdotransferase MoeA [Rhodocyclaceae bacterium]
MTHATPSSLALSVAEARRAILEALAPITGWQRVGVDGTLGRVLARDVIAPCNVPAHDNSAMDGYALRAADLAPDAETALAVVGSALAGHPFTGSVEAGQAIRIMTGAVLPRGADCVVEQEAVRLAGGQAWIPAGRGAGQNIRRAGEDLAEGGVALAAGRRLGPAELGLLASLGIVALPVYRPLRVALFSTGDELSTLGQSPRPGQIFDSNRHTLAGALARLGCEVLDMGVVPDRPEALEAALGEAAANADAILTSGGVSVGEADFVKDVLARLGEVAFWKVDMKPGRPMAFGRIGGTWLFGLPGNPVAALVSFYQFVQDALLTLMGVAPLPARPTFPVRCASPIRKLPGRREFLRGYLQPGPQGWTVSLAGPQGSGVLRSMTEANCFIVLAEEQGAVAAGETVYIQLFEGLL